MRRAVLFFLVVLPGLAAVGVSGYYLFQDWSALISAFGRFEKAIASGADLRTVYIAGKLDEVYRINAFADRVGVMLGAVLFALGVHGLCTLPSAEARPSVGSAPSPILSVGIVLLTLLLASGALASLVRRVGQTNDLRRAVIRGDLHQLRKLTAAGADPRDRLWWGKSAVDIAREAPGPDREAVLRALIEPRASP